MKLIELQSSGGVRADLHPGDHGLQIGALLDISWNIVFERAIRGPLLTREGRFQRNYSHVASTTRSVLVWEKDGVRGLRLKFHSLPFLCFEIFT